MKTRTFNELTNDHTINNERRRAMKKFLARLGNLCILVWTLTVACPSYASAYVNYYVGHFFDLLNLQPLKYVYLEGKDDLASVDGSKDYVRAFFTFKDLPGIPGYTNFWVKMRPSTILIRNEAPCVYGDLTNSCGNSFMLRPWCAFSSDPTTEKYGSAIEFYVEIKIDYMFDKEWLVVNFGYTRLDNKVKEQKTFFLVNPWYKKP